MYEKMKLRDCSNIIQNKSRAVLSICNCNIPYQELVYYDTDCFCGCISLYFKICKCGSLANIIGDNEPASLLIINNCNNYTETVELQGTLDVLEDEVDCCCREKKTCFQTVRFNLDKISGKRYCQN